MWKGKGRILGGNACICKCFCLLHARTPFDPLCLLEAKMTSLEVVKNELKSLGPKMPSCFQGIDAGPSLPGAPWDSS